MKFIYVLAFPLVFSSLTYATDQDLELKEKKAIITRLQQEIDDTASFLEEIKEAQKNGKKAPASLKKHYEYSIEALTNIKEKIEDNQFTDIKEELFKFDQTYNLFSDRFYQQASIGENLKLWGLSLRQQIS